MFLRLTPKDAPNRHVPGRTAPGHGSPGPVRRGARAERDWRKRPVFLGLTPTGEPRSPTSAPMQGQAPQGGGAAGARERVDHGLPQARAVLFRERARVRLERDRDRNRLLAGRDRLAAVVAQEAHLPTSSPPASRAAAITSPAGHALVDDEGEVLAQRRVGDDVAVEDPLRHGGEQIGEVELERAPLAVQLERPVLRDPPRLGGRPDGRARQRLRALEARLDVQRIEDRLDGALGAEEVAAEDAAQPPPLLRHRPSPTRQIDVGDLEQRDGSGCRGRRSGARRRAGRRRASFAAALLLRAERHRQLERRRVGILRLQRVGVRLEEAGADEYVGHRRRRRWSCVSRPNISCRVGRVSGTSWSRKRATSSTTSISRRTSRARQLGTSTCQSEPTVKPSRCSRSLLGSL